MMLDDQTRKELEDKYNAAVDAFFEKWGDLPLGKYEWGCVVDRSRMVTILNSLDLAGNLHPFCPHEDGTNPFRRLDRDKCPACLAAGKGDKVGA